MSQNRNKKFDPIINDARRDLLPLSRTAASTPRRTTLIRARPRAAAVHHFKRLVKRPTRWGATGVTSFASNGRGASAEATSCKHGVGGLASCAARHPWRWQRWCQPLSSSKSPRSNLCSWSQLVAPTVNVVCEKAFMWRCCSCQYRRVRRPLVCWRCSKLAYVTYCLLNP